MQKLNSNQNVNLSLILKTKRMLATDKCNIALIEISHKAFHLKDLVRRGVVGVVERVRKVGREGSSI